MSRPEPPLSRRAKIALSLGYVAAQGPQNVVHVLSHQVLNVSLGMSPVLINVLVCLQRLWGAVLDPWFGQKSDNLRTPHGRRRPLLRAAAFPLALGFAALWFLPRHWSEEALFIYSLAFSVIVYGAMSLYGVALGGLQIDVTTDYHQRTKLAALLQFAFLAFTLAVQWIYPAMQRFADPLMGLHGIGLGLGAGFLFAALAPVWFVREPPLDPATVPSNSERLSEGLAYALRSGPFVRLLIASSAANLGFYLATFFGVYLNYYYIFPGRVGPASVMQGWLGTSFQLSAIAALFGFRQLSRRAGKRSALQTAAALHIAAAAAKLTLYVPDLPWLQVPIYLLNGAAFAGVSLLSNSMIADVAEFETWRTGRRREGLYYSILGLGDKLSAAAGMLICGFTFVAIGFHPGLGLAQSAAALWRMQVLYAVFPLIGGVVAIAALRGYHLTEPVVAGVRRALEGRGAVPSADVPDKTDRPAICPEPG